jgi:hypothetical protein
MHDWSHVIAKYMGVNLLGPCSIDPVVGSDVAGVELPDGFIRYADTFPLNRLSTLPLQRIDRRSTPAQLSPYASYGPLSHRHDVGRPVYKIRPPLQHRAALIDIFSLVVGCSDAVTLDVGELPLDHVGPELV